MVGTGVFTSLGFQVADLSSGFVILVLWLIGGVCALCGALCYAELAAALPRSGGEYHFVGRTLHPALGFLAGWLSITVGFAAPIALAATALGKYAVGVLPWLEVNGGGRFDSVRMIALGAAATLTLIHLRGIANSSRFQNIATVFKIVLIVIMLGAGWAAGISQPVHFTPQVGDDALILKPTFAVNLVYVMYAYTGWNAATYIAGEMRDPVRDLPRSLLVGTGIVTFLYVGLNSIFLRCTPIEAMRGKVEVGLIAGEAIFGPVGGRIVGAFICLGLVASLSAMIWVGPRVAATMGEDVAALRFFAVRYRGEVPLAALLVQLAIVAALVVTSAFEEVLVYVQFALTLCAALAVAGLMILRVREPSLPRPFRVPLYPLTPLLFLIISGWMLAYLLLDEQKRTPSLIGLATVASGWFLYLFSAKTNTRL
jgi:APA family basic amino acid/polyamine antiporter